MSLFYWHNESINIWSHYVAAVLLSVYLYKIQSVFDLAGNIGYDRQVLSVSIVGGNIVPMLFSAFCHQFYCVNKKW